MLLLDLRGKRSDMLLRLLNVFLLYDVSLIKLDVFLFDCDLYVIENTFLLKNPMPAGLNEIELTSPPNELDAPPIA